MPASTTHRDWYRSVLDVLAAPVLVEQRERIVYVNSSYAAFLGYQSPAQLMGRHISTVIAPVDRDRLMNFGKERSGSGSAPSTYPFVAQTREGAPAAVYASVTTASMDGDCFITSVLTPISAKPSTDTDLLALLSPRERMVFDLLVHGKRQKEIAYVLVISAKTVATLRGRLMKKLRLTDSWELFQFSQRLGQSDTTSSANPS